MVLYETDNHVIPESIHSTILDVILEAANNTEVSSLPELGEDIYRLFMAWIAFGGREEVKGTVQLEVACGPINFKHNVGLETL